MLQSRCSDSEPTRGDINDSRPPRKTLAEAWRPAAFPDSQHVGLTRTGRRAEQRGAHGPPRTVVSRPCWHALPASTEQPVSGQGQKWPRVLAAVTLGDGGRAVSLHPDKFTEARRLWHWEEGRCHKARSGAQEAVPEAGQLCPRHRSQRRESGVRVTPPLALHWLPARFTL